MSTLALLVVFVLLTAVQSQTTDVVTCKDQQQACSCRPTADVCEFTLRFEQRQTFTSYALGRNGELSFDGSAYFLDRDGYHTVLNEADRPCHFDGLTNDQNFTSRNCSVPMTVDGVSYNSIITINGRTPGPTLIVTSNQLVVVHVLNYLICDAISVHWHGLFQRDTPWMDGVGFITQPPIDPGATFDYIFRAQPKGTFWYHSHVGPQRTDGLYGGLVIRDEVDTFENDIRPKILPPNSTAMIIDNPELYTLTVIDWQRESSGALFTRINSSVGFFPSKAVLEVPTDLDPPYQGTSTLDGAVTGLVPYWSGLINGRGRKLNTTLTPLSVFQVKRNQYYRFRVIGTGSLYAHKFSIDNHTLTVIATDGEYTEPYEVQFIVVHAGERYDFLVNTFIENSQHEYWIRAETLEVDLPAGVEHSARAILTYRDPSHLDWRDGYASVQDARHQCNPCRVLNCPFENFPNSSSMTCVSLVELRALIPPTDERQLPRFPPSPNCSDCMHFLNFAFQGAGTTDASINAKSFQLPTIAYQTNCNQYSEDLSDNSTNLCDRCTEASCRCTNVLPIANGAVWDASAPEFETIIMVFSGLRNTFAHPIHMHGHAYHIMYIGYGSYFDNGTLMNATQDIVCDDVCSNPRWANNTPPAKLMSRVNGANGRIVSSAIRKDTVIIPSGGYVVIALQANNPGYWFLHCHVEEHQLGGMILMLQEYTADQHRAPPTGINEHGSFIWTVADYNTTLQAGETCASDSTTTPATVATPVTAPVNPGDSDAIVSSAGFGVMLVIIILLLFYSIILTVVVIVFCNKKKCHGSTAKPKESSPPAKEEIPLR